MVMSIRPMWNTAQLNVQLPQAVRFDEEGSATVINLGSDSLEQFFCGSAGLMQNMGPDPRQLKTIGVEKGLEHFLGKISKMVEKSLKIRSRWDGAVVSDPVELKSHFG